MQVLVWVVLHISEGHFWRLLSITWCCPLTPSGNTSNWVDPGSLRTSFTGRMWYCYLGWLAVKWALQWELKEPEQGRSVGVLWWKWICSPYRCARNRWVGTTLQMFRWFLFWNRIKVPVWFAPFPVKVTLRKDTSGVPVLSHTWQMRACLVALQSLSLENIFLSTSQYCAFSLLKLMILIDLILCCTGSPKPMELLQWLLDRVRSQL